MVVAEMQARMPAVEFDDWIDFFEGDALWDRLVEGDKMAPQIATQMVWMSPAQREALKQAQAEKATADKGEDEADDDATVDDD